MSSNHRSGRLRFVVLASLVAVCVALAGCGHLRHAVHGHGHGHGHGPGHGYDKHHDKHHGKHGKHHGKGHSKHHDKRHHGA